MGSRPRTTYLVGRDVVLAEIAEERDSSTIAGRTIILAGEAGIGKTTLVRAFGEASRLLGFAVVEGVCVEIERRRPFGAFVDLLASCVRSFGEPKIRDLIVEHALFLKPLLGETAGDAPSPSQTPEDRYRIQSSMLALMESLARARAMVVIIEDLHWADEASLELFAYLARRIRHKRVLLVGTYRLDEVDRRHPLRPTIADLTNARLSHEIVLPRLTAAATGELVRASLHEHLSGRSLQEAADLIQTRCDGNPLFIEETIRLLLDSDELAQPDQDLTALRSRVRRAIPRSVNDVTLARFGRLSLETQELLTTAAVIGERVDLGIAAAVMDMPSASLAAALREAIDAGLLLETDEGAKFRHALTREAIRMSVLVADRRRLHGKVAEDMERRGVRAEELAYHFDEANLPERAIDFYERAAFATASISPAGAARALERAIELVTATDIRRTRLYTQLSDLLLIDGRTGRAEQMAIAALESAAENDLQSRSAAMAALGRVYREGEDWERNRVTLTGLRELVEPAGPSPMLARVYIELGICALGKDDAEATRLLEKATDVAEAVNDQTELVSALQILGVALYMQRRSAESLPVLERALGLARGVAAPRLMRSVMENLKDAHSEMGDESPEVERERRQQVRAFDRLHGVRAPRVLGQELEWLFADGDWDGVQRRSVEVDERGPSLMAQAQLYLGVITVGREGLQSGAGPLRSAYGDLAVLGRPDKAALALELGLLFAEVPEEVVEVALTMRDPLPTRWADPDERGLAALVGSIAARMLGDHKAAKQLSAMALEPRSYLKRRRYEACAAFSRAEIAREGGQLSEAIDGYKEAAFLSRGRIEWSSSWFESLAYLCLADSRVLRGGQGARTEAQRDFDASLGYWMDAKAAFYLRLLEARAQRLGLAYPVTARPQPRGAIPSDPLTKRQRQIAALVAEGLTNREIAERMTLSVRTAESHVEQIRAKLGFHTRAQIATWVTERLRREI